MRWRSYDPLLTVIKFLFKFTYCFLRFVDLFVDLQLLAKFVGINLIINWRFTEKLAYQSCCIQCIPGMHSDLSQKLQINEFQIFVFTVDILYAWFISKKGYHILFGCLVSTCYFKVIVNISNQQLNCRGKKQTFYSNRKLEGYPKGKSIADRKLNSFYFYKNKQANFEYPCIE